MKTVLITGSTGFIGKNIKEQLEDKYDLLTPQRSELNLLDKKQIDEYFKKNSIDVVIHSAVVGGSRKEQHVSSALCDNLRILFNILNNQNKFQKMIFFGSGAEYDKTKPIVKVKETDFGKLIPQDDYGIFKYTSAQIFNKLNNVVYLRIFGMFGKYEEYKLRFISNAICKNLFGLPITMDQNVYFDYMYIDDFVQIVDYFITHKASQKFYNIGTGKKIDLISIANIINKIADKKSKIIVKKQGLKNEYTCNNKRLLKEIKNIKFTDITEAIKELYSWYQKRQKELAL